MYDCIHTDPWACLDSPTTALPTGCGYACMMSLQTNNEFHYFEQCIGNTRIKFHEV